eukprot:CAMPEP_0198143976 /NCGR_PEP_ID=MMETSP1443-20131203/12311_1 /TAXON_ID=186043 /ORGANISM="Entomoneis sp., Strain CCMP2396" /LENGTH=90 /DNA_ID=CAMNT_0043807291 /DNA_START=105 /DNA_END=378 /DNA_ORIENTATION=+
MAANSAIEGDGSSDDNKVVCVNCAKTTQKDVPTNSTVTENCSDVYTIVDQCMKSNKGQISKCVVEWQSFKACHETKEKSNDDDDDDDDEI